MLLYTKAILYTVLLRISNVCRYDARRILRGPVVRALLDYAGCCNMDASTGVTGASTGLVITRARKKWLGYC